jgi:hypothetical protein
MKKKDTKRQLHELEKAMADPDKWENADHTVRMKSPTSVRFAADTLQKLQAVAKIRNEPVNRLINEYVKTFVDRQFALIQQLQGKQTTSKKR